MDIKGKAIKKKLQFVAIGQDSLNNTEPVKHIVEQMRQHHRAAYDFYSFNNQQRQLTLGLNNLHYLELGHPLYAFADDWDGQLRKGYFKQFRHKSTKPKFITSVRNLGRSDPVTDLLKLKNDWYGNIHGLRVSAAGRKIKKPKQLNEEVMQCSKHFVDVAAHIDSDPDPLYDGTYNWYYAGSGNLQLVRLHCTDYLLHSEFSSVYLSEFSKEKQTISPNPVATYECDDNILETACSSLNIIALRTKYKVYVLRITSAHDSAAIEEVKLMESLLPFTSITFDGYHTNILYVASIDNRFTIVNLDRMTGRTVRAKANVETLTDNRSIVVSSDRVTFTHLRKNHVNVYDKRTNALMYTWEDLGRITDSSQCNDVTVAQYRKHSPMMYIGTDHHLFLMDLRSSNKQCKAVERWTHGMQFPPTYMSICNFQHNKELICLSSQWCEDMCVVANYEDHGSEVKGITIPYRPPHVFDVLNEMRLKLHHFDMYKTIENRLATAITGKVVFELDDKYIILMQNSLGDISCHALYPEHMDVFMDDDGADCLRRWTEACQMQEKCLEVSSIIDISRLWRKLRKVPEDYKFRRGVLIEQQKKKFDEREIFETFENEEVDSLMLEAWAIEPSKTSDQNQTANDDSLQINITPSDSE